MKTHLFLLCVLLFVGNEVIGNPAPSSDSLTIFQYFQYDEPLPLTLITDFRTLERKKYSKDYQPGLLICALPDGRKDTFLVEVRTRGNMRLRVCSEPSLKLKFDKNELTARGLKEEPNTLKMVRPCRPNTLFEQYLLREFFAYKIYNVLTPWSFRVQLIRFQSIQTETKRRKKTRRKEKEWLAFFIEPEEELAARNNATLTSNKIVSSRMLNHDDTEVFALFEYMIGNTDWHVYNGHNVILVATMKNDMPRVIPIAYDFDYSGLVFTPYAVVNEKIPRDQVTERYYQGYCREREQTLATISYFLSKEVQIMGMCESFPWFDRESREHVCDYLQSFFSEMKSPRAVENYILRACGQWLKDL